MRMERARDLLAHSRMPVREVGLACGYASFSSFVRAFRTTYGITPNKARRP
jgi:transcriptional regulator GlxA family with amidase domain